MSRQMDGMSRIASDMESVSDMIEYSVLASRHAKDV